MPKGQPRSNREIRKPKAKKPATASAGASLATKPATGSVDPATRKP